MRTLLAAAVSAMALNCFANADVLANQSMKSNAFSQATPAVTPPLSNLHGSHPAAQSVEKVLQPASEPVVKWSWIPAKGAAPQTQVVMIPVPAPGAAALLGLSGLIFVRRRGA